MMRQLKSSKVSSLFYPRKAQPNTREFGRREEARVLVAEFLKAGPHSIQTELCWPFREPLKQKYLDDLRKAGMRERPSP